MYHASGNALISLVLCIVLLGQSDVINAEPAQFSLSNLNGDNGFVLTGENANDDSGGSVSLAPDINGDGISDLVVPANGANNETGKTYVIFGTKNVWILPLSLASLTGANGFVLTGENDGVGGTGFISTSSAVNINGDGISDLIVGNEAANIWTGKTYVIFGSMTLSPTPAPAPTVHPLTTSAVPTSIPSTAPSASPSNGAIVGGIVGGFCGSVFLIFIILLCIPSTRLRLCACSKKKNSSLTQSENTPFTPPALAPSASPAGMASSTLLLEPGLHNPSPTKSCV
jgi:hypothetical protein